MIDMLRRPQINWVKGSRMMNDSRDWNIWKIKAKNKFATKIFLLRHQVIAYKAKE